MTWTWMLINCSSFLGLPPPAAVPPASRYVFAVRPPLEKSCTVRQRVNNIPTPKDTVQQKKQGTAALDEPHRIVFWCVFFESN